MDINYKSLLEAAATARSHAYAPYSRFAVGAAVLTKSKKIFAGSNVENVSLGLTICAERAAVASAVANGERELTAVGIIADASVPPLPCGACRQVLAEFNPEMLIVTSTTAGQIETVKLSDLLPRPRQGIMESASDV
jgi:cytidine deaminase